MFATALACEYPVPFGYSYGVLGAEAIEGRRLALLEGRLVPGAEKWRTELHLTEEMMDVLYAQDFKVLRWWDCPDIKQPFVVRGGGAPTGLSESEHVYWGLTISHPLQRVEETVDDDLLEALDFECSGDPAELDAYRQAKVEELL